MRTKTLALCAAALAAGALTTMAQSNVYSLNIVGYANVRIGAGNDIYNNPFDLDGVNSADKVLNHAALSDVGGNPGLDSFYVNTFNGAGFNSVYFEQDFTSANTGGAVTNGWSTDASGAAQGIPPALPPGKGFFINNGGPIFTNTFVGNVVPAPGTTNNYSVVAGNQMIGSRLPVAGLFNASSFQAPIAALSDVGGNPGMDSFYVNTFNGASFNSVYYEQDFTSANTGGAVTNGWATDASGAAQGTIPNIRIGQGYFLNNGGPITTWSQTLTNAP
jgi:hypothetical protein